MDQQDISYVYNQYPWASEATMGEMLRLSQMKTAKLAAVAKQLGKDIDIQAIKNSANKYRPDTAFNNTAEYSNQVMSKMTADTDPLTATTELLETGAKGLDGLVGMVTQYTQFLGPAGAAVSRAADAATGAAVAAVGVASVFAKLATEQEKTIRAMIDYGAIASDMGFYTALRRRAADLGMSIAELQQATSRNAGMFATVTGDITSGISRFSDFADSIENTESGFPDFGYNVEQLTQRLSEEADLLYKTGGLQEMSIYTRGVIAENFRKSSAMNTYLAEIMGDQRSGLLQMREEAMLNIDFRQAMVQNGKYIAETYGQAAEQNIRDANGNLAAILGGIFGPEFASETTNLLASTIKDIHLDETSINNATRDLMDTLATLGPEVQQEYFRIMDASAKGELSGVDLTIELQGLTKLIANATPREGDDPMVQRANQLISAARTAPESFISATDQQIRDGVATTELLTEQADSSIDSIDETRKAFRHVVHALTPGHDTMSTALVVFADVIKDTGEVFAKVFGIENHDPRVQAEKRVVDLNSKVEDARKKVELRTDLISLLESSQEGSVMHGVYKQQLRDLEQTYDFERLEQLMNSSFKLDESGYNAVGVYTDPVSQEDTTYNPDLISTPSQQFIDNMFMNDVYTSLQRRSTLPTPPTSVSSYDSNSNLNVPDVGPVAPTQDIRIDQQVVEYRDKQQELRQLILERSDAYDEDEYLEITEEIDRVEQEMTEIVKRVNRVLSSDNVRENANGR